MGAARVERVLRPRLTCVFLRIMPDPRERFSVKFLRNGCAGAGCWRERYKPVPQVLIVLSDGLSTDAVLANADEIVPPLTNGLRQAGFTVGDPLFLRYGRVKAEDRLGEAIGCDVVLMLVGERPGLGQSESMSCYGVYRPTAATLESDRSVISNIHREGTPPVEAAAVIVDLVRQMMQHKASGIALNKALNPGFSG